MLLAKNYENEIQQGAKLLQSEVVWDYVATTGSLTLNSSNSSLANGLVEVTAGSGTITLPTAVGIQGRQFTIKNSGSGTVTVATTSAQTIDGSTTQTRTQYQSYTVVSNGANWIVI